MKRRETGMLGENIACDFLGKNGYHIIEKNYRCPGGEIDIIARQEDTLVFVEVRTKTSRRFGTPEESITPTKMERLRTVAAHYGQNRNNLPASWRIDVVAIQMDSRGKVSRIEIIENAVEETR
ncbi:MAG TPA: YraN family protein [Dehalococcoidales bacterium]|nr:YraN family protein [Dehalococcoidales bacterium]